MQRNDYIIFVAVFALDFSDVCNGMELVIVFVHPYRLECDLAFRVVIGRSVNVARLESMDIVGSPAGEDLAFAFKLNIGNEYRLGCGCFYAVEFGDLAVLIFGDRHTFAAYVKVNKQWRFLNGCEH